MIIHSWRDSRRMRGVADIFVSVLLRLNYVSAGIAISQKTSQSMWLLLELIWSRDLSRNRGSGSLEETCPSEETVLSKFMQSLGDFAYTKLRKIADDRDITVQELIRAIVIPDWLKFAEAQNGGSSQSERRRKRISRAGATTPALHLAVASRSKKKQ